MRFARLKRSVFVCFSCVVLCAITAGAVSPEAVELTPVYINELAEQMRTNNPGLRAAAQRLEAAVANQGSVKVWEDPVTKFGVMGATEMMRANDGDLLYGVEQMLPLFGRAAAEKRMAAAERGVAEVGADYKFQTLRLDLARTLFGVGLAAEEWVIGQEDLAWIEAIAGTVEQKYRAGQATLAEVLQIQNERARRASQLKSQSATVEAGGATLNRLLNRSSTNVWPTFRLPPPATGVLFNQTLIDFALRYEPRSRQLREEIKQADAGLDRTRRGRFPDVGIGVEGRNYSGDGRFRQAMVTVSVSLPWLNRSKYQSSIRRDGLKVEAARKDLEDLELALVEDLRRLTIKIENARREAALYREEIIPRSQTALESARAGWETGRETLRDMLEARRMLLEARVMRARATGEQYQMLSELVLCCGIGDLEALKMLGEGVVDNSGKGQK